MNTPIPTPTAPVIQELNPDRSFFESILPSISDFTEDQKLDFRCEVLNIIKRMSKPPQSIPQYHTSVLLLKHRLYPNNMHNSKMFNNILHIHGCHKFALLKILYIQDNLFQLQSFLHPPRLHTVTKIVWIYSVMKLYK